MKKILGLFIIIIGLCACNENIDGNEDSNPLLNVWHYTSMTGSEGPECFYEKGDKIYTFSSNRLTVVDNYELHNACVLTFKEHGEYDYEVKIFDGREYLFIDDIEQGRIRFIDGDLLIESWFHSSGVVIDDAPTYHFETQASKTFRKIGHGIKALT